MSGLEGLLAGRTLVKRYRIEQVIGRGGFAAVYRADDERLGRPVAVKVITLAAPDEATREHLRERFQREARAAASLPQHPNVVTVHDFGTDPELGLDFLVMEFLHGEDLATHLARQRKLPLESALRILRDAVEGVAVGHRAGLVHRDVKPGNIFLAEPHGEDPFRVCVVDFGIARVATKDQAVTRLTQTGIPLSPAYASPEQLRGDRNLSATSDVFSLGVVAYQLLTGEKPLRADRSAEPQDWVPERALRDLNPEVTPAVEEVIARAMSFDAAARYPDADAMADALERAMQEAPSGNVAAAPVPIPVPVPVPVDVADAQSVTIAPEPEAVPVPPPAAPVSAPAFSDDEEERTLLQPEIPPPPPPAGAGRATVPVGAAAPKRSFATWGLVLLIAGLVTVAGLWALTRGSPGGESDRTGADIILESGGPAEGAAPPSTGPRVTGEIVETPGVDPGTGFPAPGTTVDPSAPLPSGGSQGGGGASGQAPITRPGVTLPPASRPGVTLPPQGGAGQQPQQPQPQPQQPQQPQPQPQQPQQAQPQQPQPAAPVLLGRPVEPAPGAGGGVTPPQQTPRPDTTGGG